MRQRRRYDEPKDQATEARAPAAPRAGEAGGRGRGFETLVGRRRVLRFVDPPDRGTLRLGLYPRTVSLRVVDPPPGTPASTAVTWLFVRGGMSLVLLASLLVLGLVGGIVSGH